VDSINDSANGSRIVACAKDVAESLDASESHIRCLVLGSTGFIGSHLVEDLVRHGFEVRALIRPGSSRRKLPDILERIEVVEGDFEDGKALASAVEGCVIVFHLISTTVPSSSNRDPGSDVQANLVTTVRFIETCRRADVKKIVFGSSGGAVYGASRVIPITEDFPTHPQSSYGIVKLAIEKYLQLYHHQYGLKYAVLRMGNVYGPRLPLSGEQNAVGAFLRSAYKQQPLTVWGDGSVLRDYIYVSDVVRAFRAALRERLPVGVFNVGTSVGTSLTELIQKIQVVTGQKLYVRWEPSRRVDVPQNVLAIDRARNLLSWQPIVDLEAGLNLTWKWVCSNREMLEKNSRFSAV
jgi:UDP-glucose 4-epimerase